MKKTTTRKSTAGSSAGRSRSSTASQSSGRSAASQDEKSYGTRAGGSFPGQEQGRWPEGSPERESSRWGHEDRGSQQNSQWSGQGRGTQQDDQWGSGQGRGYQQQDAQFGNGQGRGYQQDGQWSSGQSYQQREDSGRFEPGRQEHGTYGAERAQSYQGFNEDYSRDYSSRPSTARSQSSASSLDHREDMWDQEDVRDRNGRFSSQSPQETQRNDSRSRNNFVSDSDEMDAEMNSHGQMRHNEDEHTELSYGRSGRSTQSPQDQGEKQRRAISGRSSQGSSRR